MFESPSVLEPSAPEPTAVLKLAMPLPLESLLKSAKFTDGSVTKAVSIGKKGASAKSVVSVSVKVVKERPAADSIVVRSAVVIDKRGISNGRVLCAGGVEQHRCSANGGIGITRVEDERSSANTGVEVGVDH